MKKEDQIHVDQCGYDFPAITWARLSQTYAIVDLRELYYDEVLDMIKDNYLATDVLCKTFRIINHKPSLDSFTYQVMRVLKQGTSIIMINHNNDEVIGALLLLIVNKLDFGRVFSRTDISQGSAYNYLLKFKTALNKKADIFCDYKCNEFMRFYLLCIKREYRGNKFGTDLLKCGLEVAQSLHMSIACGMFGNRSLQRCAEKIGFENVHEIQYSDWCDEKEALKDIEICNTSCALMVATVPPPIVTEMVVDNTEEKSNQDKKGNKKQGKKK